MPNAKAGSGKRGQSQIANPLKKQGSKVSKGRAQQMSDKANPTHERRPARATLTRQGGSKRGGGKPDTAHPAQRGGVKAEDRLEELRAGRRGGEVTGERRQRQGLTKAPSRSRRSAAVAGANAGRQRTGRSRAGDASRRRARGRSRTRDES